MPSEDELQSTQNKSQEKLPLKDMEAESEALYEGLPRLNTKEAYEIAVKRGFEGKEASFRSGFSRGEKSKQEYRQKYAIVKIGKKDYVDVLSLKK